MEHVKFYESLTNVVNKLSIRLEIRGAVDLIATIAVLAKQEPDSFALIYKSPKVNINEVVAKSLAAISCLQGLIDESLERISNDDLRDAIYYIGEVTDFVLLADNIIELIRQQAYRSFGEAMLSTSIAKLCVSLAGNVSNKIVYDGTAGFCTLTTQLQGAKLELAEVNRTIWGLGKKLLLLKNVAANFRLQDSLSNSDAHSIQADLVIMSPPFGVRFNNDQISQIQHASFILLDKEIPKSASDALWVQHALFNTSATGKAILVTPIGWLFRGGYDAYLIQYLLDHDFD